MIAPNDMATIEKMAKKVMNPFTSTNVCMLQHSNNVCWWEIGYKRFGRSVERRYSLTVNLICCVRSLFFWSVAGCRVFDVLKVYPVWDSPFPERPSLRIVLTTLQNRHHSSFLSYRFYWLLPSCLDVGSFQPLPDGENQAVSNGVYD